MVWYKVWAKHGGGHMCYTEKYIYREKPLSPSERRNIWESFADSMNNASGGVNKVERPPEAYAVHQLENLKSEFDDIIPEFERLKKEVKRWKKFVSKKIKPKQFLTKEGGIVRRDDGTKVDTTRYHCAITSSYCHGKKREPYIVATVAEPDAQCDKCEYVTKALQIIRELPDIKIIKEKITPKEDE